MAYTKYSLTPADNNAAPPNGAPEGMLPSAVNDTMRDMMSQIRDVGDGIRGGTYTMTAPVITGGSITGVALSGNTLTNPVITGGSINNTTVGATTRSTGAFTTLASNGATTFTAGTASTSTTTGTAVITGGLGVSGRINAANFDGIVGANTAAAGNFTTLGASGVATFSAGTVSAPAITTTGDTNTGIFFPAADTIAFTEGGVESMRIDSAGNVGIGLTSPFARLDLGGATTGQTLLFSNSGTNGTARLNMRIAFRTGSLGTVTNLITSDITGSFDDSSDLRFYTGGGNERMRITSAGNVGIGTSSPASILHTYAANNAGIFELTGGGGITLKRATAVGNNSVLHSMNFSNSDSIVGAIQAINVTGGTTSTGTGYEIRTVAEGLGRLTFYTNSSERMRLDSSGNLGLGVTPSAWGSGWRALQIGSLANINSSDSWLQTLANAYYDGSNYRYIASQASSRYLQNSGAHSWGVAASGTAGNAITFTQAMTLDASGNLGVGYTSPRSVANYKTLALGGTSNGGLLDMVNASGNVLGTFYSDSTGSLVINADPNGSFASSTVQFQIDGTERMRIDSSGSFLVGTTTANNNNSSSFAFNVANGNQFNNHISGTASGTGYIQFALAGTVIGTITQNGTTAVAYNTSSDYRLKENIAPMTGALAKVQALKPVTYNWKADGSSGQGFIAHELQAVVPDCVTGEKDAVDAEGKPVYQGIDTSFLIATLTAAIQELKAIVDQQSTELDSVKAELQTLKGN